jgi:hypothetical protein
MMVVMVQPLNQPRWTNLLYDNKKNDSEVPKSEDFVIELFGRIICHWGLVKVIAVLKTEGAGCDEWRKERSGHSNTLPEHFLLETFEGDMILILSGL